MEPDEVRALVAEEVARATAEKDAKIARLEERLGPEPLPLTQVPEAARYSQAETYRLIDRALPLISPEKAKKTMESYRLMQARAGEVAKKWAAERRARLKGGRYGQAGSTAREGC